MSTFLSRGLYPVVLVVLARLLSPEAFGLAAMAITVTTLFSCFSDLGLKHAMVQQKGDTEKIASLAFCVLLPLGVVWFIVIWFIAPFIGEYFKNLEVVPMVRTLGLMFIIQPLSDVPLSILLRDLKFKALFYRQLVPQLFSGVTSITLAFMGYGAWALVLGTLAGIAGTAIVVWRQTDWRPRIFIETKLLNSMFKFGSFVSIQRILGWMTVKADHLFVGRFLGASVLGIYRVGHTYGNLPLQVLGGPFHSVIYPIFCKISGDINEVKQKYHAYIKWVSVINIPIGVAFIFIVPFLVPVLLGDKWLAAIPVMQLITVTSMLSSIVGVNAEVYKAIGRPDVGVKFFICRVIVSMPFYYFAAQKSIVVLALTHVGLACFFVPINILVCSFVLGIKYLGVLGKIKTGMFLGLIQLVAGLSYNYFIGDNYAQYYIGNTLGLVFLLSILGGCSLYLIDRKMLTTILDLIKSSLTVQKNEVSL